MIEDIKTGPAEVHVGRFWVEVEYRRDGQLRIEQFSGATEHEARRKAERRVNELIEGA